jgi:hypothetical protein
VIVAVVDGAGAGVTIGVGVGVVGADLSRLSGYEDYLPGRYGEVRITRQAIRQIVD